MKKITVIGTAYLRVDYSVELPMSETDFDALPAEMQNDLLETHIDWLEECKQAEVQDFDVDEIEETEEGEENA